MLHFFLSKIALRNLGYIVKDSKIVLGGPQGNLKENKGIKEFHMGLSGLRENIKRYNTSEETRL